MVAQKIFAAALLSLGACGTDGFFEVIAPEAPGGNGATCASSTSRPVDMVEVGRLDPLVDPPLFSPLADGDEVQIVVGPQGLTMIVLALRVTGAGNQTCIAQRTDVYGSDGERISYNSLPKRFALQPDGTVQSDGIYFPGAYAPGPTTIETTLGGQTLVRVVEVAP